jgi:hypothetical protein
MDKRPSVIARHLAEVHRVGSFFTCPHGACRFKEVPSRRVVFHHLTTHHGVAEKQAAELVAGLEPIVRGEKDAVDYDEAEGTEAALAVAAPRRSLSTAAAAAAGAAADDNDDIACSVCGSVAHAESMLLCDGCDSGVHLNCLTPALVAIPKGAWFCGPCRAAAPQNARGDARTITCPRCPVVLSCATMTPPKRR